MALSPESPLRFEALKALSAVARHGSVQAAAEACSQSAAKLHRLLRAQEQHLGVALVTTSARGSTLTAAGERLRAYADTLIHAVSDADTSARQEHRELNGTLRLQAPQALMEPLLVPLVLRLQEQHPALKICLLADEYPIRIESDAPAHLRLMRGPLPASAYARPLGDLRVGLFASPRYLDKTGRPGSLQGLARHALIHCSSEGQAPVWRLAEDYPLRFEPRLAISTSAAALRAAIGGAGVVCCYQLQARRACEQGLLEPVAEPLWPAGHPLALTYTLGIRAPASVMAFLELATPWLRTQLVG
ncbi:LysR family transcriptional regulator [Vreelandella titanicae]|jgi:DNA-binding transcriptional LysR family regulator|uniref:LysR, substrate-binding n=1 Tax=Vreelandella titanicae BH1 TaxID=1204738 RepID=L9UCD9_9GAMM|nr:MULTISPECIES: LysR family transcriptional regulator [Halomonas]NAO94819.1 LysR family transcriptional regulator [Halomonas sp. MG34]QGQ71808.1 LysR family transcriptional regulator [Halomonas sp. PA16-9]ELY22635.1 LysR, substrate-binding [Halomonas titanicae BH1]NVE88890.1 LysR family transcriptional regulator [Halomonas titanicae]PKH60433.1 LysR family transcriptional regulator [Halomonas sp. Choline-3u-9]|tara:strand:- start:576 stop:1484 length:909 start_codon:yes stop_codon:yes gene_type:complete